MGRRQVRASLDNLALQAKTAGAAFGCRFLTAAEYEADLIAQRRRAGAYAARQEPALVAAVLLATLLCVLVF